MSAGPEKSGKAGRLPKECYHLDYSDLSRGAEDILDFLIPEGLGFYGNKRLSPCFARSIALGAANGGYGSVGFSYSSHPLAMVPYLSAPEDGKALGRASSWSISGGNVLYSRPTGSYSLTGSIYSDHSLDYTCERRHTDNLFLSAWGLLSKDLSVDNHNGHLFYTRPRFATKLLWMSDEKWLGLSGLARLNDELRIGGELLFSVATKAPGVSLGGNYIYRSGDAVYGVATATYTPISGHFAFTYTSRIHPRLRIATRYEYNYYSLESDLAVGADIRSEPRDMRLRLRFSLAEGFSMLLEGRIQALIIGLGGTCNFASPFTHRLGLSFTVNT